MTDILDLPDWKAKSSRSDGSQYLIEADYLVHPSACLKCGSIGHLYKHGTKKTIYTDSPIRGLPVRLVANVQRYRCRDCGETFLQPLGAVLDDRRMTRRCAEYITDQGMRDTFSRVAEHIGCDEKTVRNVASSAVALVADEFRPYVPESLGIDETQLSGVMRLVLTDVDRRLPVDILPNREPASLAQWLHSNRAAEKVLRVTTDMYPPYKNVVRDRLPGVPVVVDKFHVLKMADFAVETIRRKVSKSKPKEVGREWKRQSVLLRMRNRELDERGRFNLDMWMSNEPTLATAYWAKERLYDIYKANSRAEAEMLLDQWRASIPPEIASVPRHDFKAVLTATKNWREEILAYFDNPITNGYTEAFNGLIKIMNRRGRGYSFEVIRARMLWPLQQVLRLDSMPKHEELRHNFESSGVFMWPNNTGFPMEAMRAYISQRHQAVFDRIGGQCPSCLGVFTLPEMTVREETMLCRKCAERAV